MLDFLLLVGKETFCWVETKIVATFSTFLLDYLHLFALLNWFVCCMHSALCVSRKNGSKRIVVLVDPKDTCKEHSPLRRGEEF